MARASNAARAQGNSGVVLPKPPDCTCKFPEAVVKNMVGHEAYCPVYFRHASHMARFNLPHEQDNPDCPGCKPTQEAWPQEVGFARELHIHSGGYQVHAEHTEERETDTLLIRFVCSLCGQVGKLPIPDLFRELVKRKRRESAR